MENSSSSSPPPLPHHQLLSTLLISAVPLLLFIIFITRSRPKLPYPPGPKGFPVIGNMLMMDQLTHRGLARLAEQYGGLFHLKMGSLHMVAISSPEIARDVLQAQDSVFSNRPATMAIAYLTYDRADMAFAQYGPFWRQMRKICVMKDVMFGGIEAVALAIEWSMAVLMKNREDLKKVQQELADVVGLDRKVNESDLENLPYFKCVIKETLRLHPPIPLLLHETAADAAVAGFRIPAKSRVMINTWAINRDKDSWVDPDSFKPSRFLNGRAPDFKGSNFEFLPFGSGRRSCPGMQLALYAMELAVAHLCHCYSWELPDGMKPSELDMNDVFGLTAPRAIQLVAVPSHRLLGSLA